MGYKLQINFVTKVPNFYIYSLYIDQVKSSIIKKKKIPNLILHILPEIYVFMCIL